MMFCVIVLFVSTSVVSANETVPTDEQFVTSIGWYPSFPVGYSSWKDCLDPDEVEHSATIKFCYQRTVEQGLDTFNQISLYAQRVNNIPFDPNKFKGDLLKLKDSSNEEMRRREETTVRRRVLYLRHGLHCTFIEMVGYYYRDQAVMYVARSPAFRKEQEYWVTAILSGSFPTRTFAYTFLATALDVTAAEHQLELVPVRKCTP